MVESTITAIELAEVFAGVARAESARMRREGNAVGECIHDAVCAAFQNYLVALRQMVDKEVTGRYMFDVKELKKKE